MLVSPAPRRERALVVAAFAVLALLRLATIAPDPWEWDEVLFTEGVRDGLDVRVNHPHAPGYPVFIRLGQGIHALGVEPFRATALAGALGGYLSVLALYLLLRELGSRREWALTGALFYALTPSVWLHGVRPLSDGPGAAAALFASVFFVRAIAGKGGPNLVWAAALAALAAGVRPQVGFALVPAAAVAAALVFRRERRARPLVLAVLAGVLLSAAIWIPVFRGSGGFSVWKQRLDEQMQYVTQFDSPKARDILRLPFWKRWWLDPVGHGKIAAGFLALGLAGAALERRKAGLVLLLFVPVTALTLGVLSTDSAPRYVVAFWTAPCAFAAFALEWASRRRGGRVVAPAAAVLFLAAFAALGAPGVTEVATRPSPSVAVMKALGAAGLAARDVFVTEVLRVHAGEFFGSEARVVDELIPLRIPPGAVLVSADNRPFGLTTQRVFAFETPLLARISRGRYLRTLVFEGQAGAGVFAPSVTRPGWQLHGRVELPEGTTLSVRSAGPADVAFSGSAAGEGAEIEMKTAAGARRAEVVADRDQAMSFAAVPDVSEVLFTISSRRGRAILEGFRIVARESGQAATHRRDDGIPASIDEPAEGARVRPPFLARGWCQERGGGRVDPVEFRIDGFLLEETPITRTPRPDVAAVLPAIGDASAAGWEARLAPNVPPGRHLLTVTFQAGDRRRVYPPRAIEIVAPGEAAR
jgi:4-amino-4-deoxy-L-arabinose transferase-like glycosyltransferase